MENTMVETPLHRHRVPIVLTMRDTTAMSGVAKMEEGAHPRSSSEVVVTAGICSNGRGGSHTITTTGNTRATPLSPLNLGGHTI